VKQPASFLARLERIGRAGEDALLVTVLTAMIGLAASQIVLRNFLNLGFIWGDELLRMLVLWIAVAGAVAASRNDRHINIAILDRFLPDKGKIAVKILVDAFTSVICGIVTWHSLQFVRTSHEFGDVLLGNVPAWLLQSILPLGFALICYRYGIFVIRGLLQLGKGRERL
jgi:TRAP-type C4-dicarboxylate transport system permease small subunit